VKNYLATRGKLEEAGGAELLSEIWDFVPTGEGWCFYANGLLEHYQRRVAIREAGRLIEQMHDLQSSVEETIREVIERTFAKLAIQGNREKMLKDYANEFLDILQKRSEQVDAVTGIDFGLPALDEIVGGLQGGEVCVIAADTGVGKSALALQAIRMASLDRGLPVALFSLEMSWVQLLERIHMQSGVPLQALRRGIFTKSERAIVTETTQLLIERNNIFIEDDFGLDIAGIYSRSRALKVKDDIKLIVVDYLQLVGASGVGRDANREREVAAVSHRLKALAHELDLIVLSLSQLNDQGLLRESRAIGQDADVVLVIKRPESEGEPHEILVRKHRNGQAGVTIPVRFRGEQMRFESNTNR
jgi:replicative DNA helicase